MVILAVLCWSGNFIVARGVHAEVPPMALAFWRWAVALLVLLPFSVGPLKRQWRLILRNRGIIALLALLSVSNFSMFIYMALNATTAVNAVLLNSLTPVFIVMVSRLTGGERASAAQAAGIAVSLSGLVFIITRGNLASLAAFHFSGGDLWVMAAGISWAFYSVLLKRLPSEIEPLAYLPSAIIMGMGFILPFYLWEMLGGTVIRLTPATVGSVLYVAVFASVLAYVFWNGAVRELGPNRTGIFIHLMPVSSIILAGIFLGERLMEYHLWGASLIFSGIFLTTRKRAGFRTVPVNSNAPRIGTAEK